MALQDLCNFQDVFLDNAAKKDVSVLLRRGQNGGFLPSSTGVSPFCFQIPVTDYLDESPIQFGQIPQSPVQGSAADVALDSISLPGLHGLDEPLPFPMAHGTTTLAFIFQGGVLAAADTRSSCSGLVACPSAQKIIPIHSHLVGTTSGTSADCALWKRILSRELRLYQLRHGRCLSTAGAAKLLAHMLHPFKGTELCVAATLCGWDGGDVDWYRGRGGGDGSGGGSERENAEATANDVAPGPYAAGDGSETEVSLPAADAADRRGAGPSLYYVCSDGTRLQGRLFSVGSGSPYAYSVLDGSVRWGLTDEEAVSLGREAVYRATRRDAYSGNCVDVYHVTAKGWTRRPREDLKEEFYREEEREARRLRQREEETRAHTKA